MYIQHMKGGDREIRLITWLCFFLQYECRTLCVEWQRIRHGNLPHVKRINLPRANNCLMLLNIGVFL